MIARAWRGATRAEDADDDAYPVDRDLVARHFDVDVHVGS